MTLTDPPDPSTIITDDHQTASESDVPALDYYPDLIEVTFDTDIDTDTLQLYFESKRSGGNMTKELKVLRQLNKVLFMLNLNHQKVTECYFKFRPLILIIFDRCSSCYFTGEAFTYEE